MPTSQSLGKNFEHDFRNSCPDSLLVYRPPDAAQSFNKDGGGTRFSRRSPCDFMIFDGEHGELFMFELKTFDGACAFERSKEDKGNIHYYQIESLQSFTAYPHVHSGFVLDFRKFDRTYYLSIKDWDNLVDSIPKKSFTERDMKKYTHPILIDKKKKRTTYTYDVEKLLKDVMDNDL